MEEVCDDWLLVEKGSLFFLIRVEVQSRHTAHTGSDWFLFLFSRLCMQYVYITFCVQVQIHYIGVCLVYLVIFIAAAVFGCVWVLPRARVYAVLFSLSLFLVPGYGVNSDRVERHMMRKKREPFSTSNQSSQTSSTQYIRVLVYPVLA